MDGFPNQNHEVSRQCANAVHLDRILQVGKEQGEISETTDLRIVRQMIFGTIDETCTTWVMTGQKYDLVGLTEHVHQLLLQGILKQ